MRIAAIRQRRPRHDEEPRSMNDSNGYAVFFFPQALEALGDAIKPYLQESPAGAHVVCNEIDTGGALVEMTLHGHDSQDRDVRSEEHTSELQSLMRISYAVICLKKNNHT